MAIDRDAIDQFLRDNPVSDEAGLQALEAFTSKMRRELPMIPDESIDVVVSNCVLNLVDSSAKEQLFREIFRVLKIGGRAVISDIVSDETVPQHLRDDGELWSGCISGAFQELEFLQAFQHAGFRGIEVPVWQKDPWQTVEGIEFRSATVIAYKSSDDPCLEHNEAVMYRGPFSAVHDDDGHVFGRGQRIAVCRKTYEALTRPPFADHFIAIEPRVAIDPKNAKSFDCSGPFETRPPSVTKGKDYRMTVLGDACCDTGECC